MGVGRPHISFCRSCIVLTLPCINASSAAICDFFAEANEKSGDTEQSRVLISIIVPVAVAVLVYGKPMYV